MIHPYSTTQRFILCLFAVLALFTLLQTAQAESIPDLGNDKLHAFRSLPPSVTTANPRKPTPETCKQQDLDSCIEGTGMGQDHESPAADYKPNVFKLAPKKKAKVEAQRKKEPNPDGGDVNCSENQTACYGECCSNQSQHCAIMRGLHQYSTAWSTCCPKGQQGDKHGACCRPGKIGKDNMCH